MPNRLGAVCLAIAAWGMTVFACGDASIVTCTAADADQGCSCTADADVEGNDAQCTAEGDGGAVCCAAEAWPEDSTFCECSGRWRCQSGDGSTCACQLGALPYEGVPEVATCAPAEGGTCCQFWDTCNCGNGPCEEGHVQVADCSFAAVESLVAAYRCETQKGGVAIDTCVPPAE